MKINFTQKTSMILASVLISSVSAWAVNDPLNTRMEPVYKKIGGAQISFFNSEFLVIKFSE